MGLSWIKMDKRKNWLSAFLFSHVEPLENTPLTILSTNLFLTFFLSLVFVKLNIAFHLKFFILLLQSQSGFTHNDTSGFLFYYILLIMKMHVKIFSQCRKYQFPFKTSKKSSKKARCELKLRWFFRDFNTIWYALRMIKTPDELEKFVWKEVRNNKWVENTDTVWAKNWWSNWSDAKASKSA